MASPVAGAAAAAAARLLEDDRLSWEDSERFEEDSLSWLSDPESLCQNWRGWSVPGRPNEHTACSSSAVAATPVNAALPLLYTGGIAAQPCPSSPPPARPPPSCSSGTAAAVGGARCARPTVTSLKDLTAKVIAQHKTFEEVEHFSYSQLHMATPEPLQLKIAYWCFPGADEDIRLYSCLANGNADEFHRGESLFKSNCVRRVLQIGFHLSANVCHSSLMWLRGADGSMRPSGEAGITADAAADCGGLMGPSARWHNVAVTVDRCKIISCMCSGCPNGYWCCHVVALCLYRIHNVNSVRFRPPVSESLNHLKDKQLRKFAQYLISELPRDILPTAQRILDELLSTGSNMNALDGAPDPTAGACRDETAAWALNEHTLNDNIRKILHKFCIPSPTVFSDVNYLSTQQPPIANEWQALLRPLRSREPEGLCNLLSIVREMFRRRDDNAAVLLHIITERCMHTMQVVLWWYQVSLSQSGQYPMCIGAAAGSGASAANAGGPSTSAAASGSAKSGLLSNFHSAQFSCAYLCDEIVDLWRLAAMSPRINQARRAQLADHLKGYHGKVVEKVWNVLVSQVRNQGMNHANHHHHQAGSGVTNTLASVGHMAVPGYGRITAHTARFDLDAFPGFRPAVQSCRVNWPLETRRQLAVLHASDQPPLPLAVAVPEDALQDADGTRQHGQVVVGAKGGDMCRSPFSPNLPILRDKHVRTTLLNASSCETVVAVGLDGAAAASAAAPDAPLERDAAASPAGSRSSSPESGQGSSDASVPGNGRQQPAAVPPPAHQASASQRSPHQRDSGGDEEPNDGLEHLINMYLAQDEPGSAAQRQQQRRHSSPQPGAAADLLPDSPVSTVDSLLAALPATSCDAAFTVCEALHAHGYGDEARALAERLAGRVLRDGPSPFCRFLDQPLPGNVPPDSRLVPAARCAAAAGGSGKRKKKQQQEPPTVPHPRALEASRVASTFYKRTLFLCSVLLQKRCEHWRHRVAFELALHALAAPRPPAATKYYEIECYHMEGEVVATLKRMHVHVEEMNMVRAAAKRLRALEVSSGAPLYVVPFSLAHYVFDTLCSSDKYQFLTKSGDEELGFAAAGAVLAMRTCASEATQALLCETMRRQRGDLAVALLLRFKDDHEKLAVIMDRLLDPELHRMYKQTGCNAAYYGHQAVAAHRRLVMQLVAQEMGHPAELHHTLSNMAIGDQCGAQLHADATTCGKVPVQSTSAPRDEAAHADTPELSGAAAQAGRLLIERHSSDSRSTGSGGTAAGSTSSTGAGPQVTDAHAHYMSELAKRVLTEAGGNHSSAMFNAPAAAAGAAAAVDGNVPQAGVHRALHMCAFHIGLYALGLHNKVTQNWQSRTYSSQWSWLMNQAIEIGRPALRLLVDTWHEHMTPTEVAQLADKASQGYRAEPAMVAAAAELALCALHNAHALNQIDLNKALVQCKEQSTSMLERACCAVEQAAKDYGVYPDVLFVVARRWHDLFHELERHDATRRRNAPAHAAAYDVAPGVYRHNVQATAPAAYCAPPMAGYQQHVGPGQPQPHHAPPYQHQYGVLAAAGGNGGAPLQHVQSTVMTPPCANMFFGQQPAPASAVYMGAHPTSGRPLHVSQSAPALGPHHGFAAGSHQLRAAMYMQHAQQQQQQQHHHHQQQQHQHQQQQLGMQSHMQPQQQQQQHMAGGGDERQMQHERLKYLLSAYRVGMLAMETMGKRIHDDRSYHKYSQNPPYGDDVRWLFGVSQKLGLVYAYQFCLVAAESVVSPFVLWDLALESTRLFPPTFNAHMAMGGSNNVSLSMPPPPVSANVVTTVQNGVSNSIPIYHPNDASIQPTRSQATSGAAGLQSAPVPSVGCAPQPCAAAATASAAGPGQSLYQRMQQQSPHLGAAACGMSGQQLQQYAVKLHGVTAAIGRTGVATPATYLLQRCLHAFYVAANQKLSHPKFQPADGEELFALVRAAKTAFHQVPSSGAATAAGLFSDFLQHIRRQKACKKDIWNKVLAIANAQ